MELWLTNKTGQSRYWIVGQPSCESCHKAVWPTGFHIREWGKNNKYVDHLLCQRCYAEKPVLTPWLPIHERRQAIITEKRPTGSLLVFPVRPSVKRGVMSVYDAADERKNPSIKTNDKTLLAGRADSTFLDEKAPVVKGCLTQGELLKIDRERIENVNEGLLLLDNLRGDLE